MSSQLPCRWFVILRGDDVNSIIARSFPDANLHEGLHIQVDGKQPESRDAWEILPSELETLSTFLLTGNFKIKPLVAVKVDDEPVRYAAREEYDANYRSGLARRESTLNDVREKTSRRCTRKPIARMKAKSR